MNKIGMTAEEPINVEDAFKALVLVEDINELVDNGDIRVEVDDDGEPRLYPNS